MAARSARHLRELSVQVAAGDRAVALFVVQRTDCDRFAPAEDLDPAFARALREALAAGVEVLVYRCDVAPDGVAITTRILDGLPRLSPATGG